MDTETTSMEIAGVTAAVRATEISALLRREPRLERLVDLARARFMAREVWLFGSRARGDNRPDSDWDILIVVDDDTPDEALDPVRLWYVGRDAGLVADVIADRVSDLRACEDVVTTIPYEVKREGIRLA
jgi:predicted nucleotidyltransferase